jgi:hypothetical protein
MGLIPTKGDPLLPDAGLSLQEGDHAGIGLRASTASGTSVTLGLSSKLAEHMA